MMEWRADSRTAANGKCQRSSSTIAPGWHLFCTCSRFSDSILCKHFPNGIQVRSMIRHTIVFCLQSLQEWHRPVQSVIRELRRFRGDAEICPTASLSALSIGAIRGLRSTRTADLTGRGKQSENRRFRKMGQFLCQIPM